MPVFEKSRKSKAQALPRAATPRRRCRYLRGLRARHTQPVVFCKRDLSRRFLCATQTRTAAKRFGSRLWPALPDFVGRCGLYRFHGRSNCGWRRRSGYCRPSHCRPGYRRLQARPFRVLVRFVMARHLAQTAHQGETLIRIFLSHGINIQLKPVLGLLRNEFLHMCMNVVPANNCIGTGQVRPAPS